MQEYTGDEEMTVAVKDESSQDTQMRDYTSRGINEVEEEKKESSLPPKEESKNKLIDVDNRF